MDFRDVLKKSIRPERPTPHKWFYISARHKADGSFAGAIILQEENSVVAALKGTPLIGRDVDLGERAEVPAEDLPPEQFRNRKLTLEEIEKLI